MSGSRLFGIAVILAVASAAWLVLAGATAYRTDTADGTGRENVGSLWGEPQTQSAPTFTTAKRTLDIASSDISADFSLDQRKKGLLWYSTYTVDFDAVYGIRNDTAASMPVTMRFAFPTPDGVYDGFEIRVGEHAVPVRYEGGTAVATFDIAPGATENVSTGYKTQGLDEWRYAPATDGVAVVRNFDLAMHTDFDGMDFPDGAVSPVSKERDGAGWTLGWAYDSLVSGRQIGIRMPKPINPGPVASRISMFAPVSLLFFFAAVILVSATRGVRIHPMNYGFLAAGFFAFHLLFAYLVDRVDIGVAFAIASVTSVALCVGYVRLFVKDRQALIELAASQIIFLVLFSFTFFFEGLTGLAITIGSVITLGYFMARTGNLDWETIFAKNAEEKRRRVLERFPPLDPPVPTTPPASS